MKGVFVSAAGADIWVQQYFFLKFKRDGDGKKLGMPRAHWVGPCWSLRSRSLASVFSGLGRSWLQWRRPDEPLDSIWSISAKSIEGSGVCLGETRENKDIREKPPHALFSLEDRRYTLAFMQINKKFLEGLLNSQLLCPVVADRNGPSIIHTRYLLPASVEGHHRSPKCVEVRSVAFPFPLNWVLLCLC